jgi:diguanylate cyclase (GGDEF)-like protein/PAS domain S-box-containing protein
VDEALRESEERFRNTFEHAAFGMALVNAEGRIFQVNQAACSMFGYLPEELIGKQVLEVTHADDRDVSREHMRELRNGRTDHVFMEKRYLHKDGHTLWGSLSTSALRDAQGNFLYYIAEIVDITERRRIEEKILNERDFSRAALDSLPGIVYVFDSEGRFLRWNKNFETVSEYSSDEISTMSPLGFFAGSDKLLIRQKIQETFEKGSADAEADFITKSGRHKPYYYTGRIIQIEGKSCLIGMGVDITGRKQAETAVQESRERFKNLVEASSDWVWEMDERGVYTYASPQVREILGYEPAEVLGKRAFDLMPSGEAERVASLFSDITASQKPFSLLENVNLHKNGDRVVLETSGVPFFDSTGSLRGYRGIDRDITERKRAEETIKYQAYHDLLTGLPNRTLFADMLEHEIVEMHRLGKKLAVLFLDVDQFKNVNDSFGHAAGDRLIQHIAGALRNSIRELDTLARIGGDEFTLMLPLMSRPEDASRIADKVMQTFQRSFIVDHHELRLTASIGISIYPEDGQDAGLLLKNADIALHFAKDQGRDNYQFYNSSISHRTLERVIFENRLRQAVERGELVVHYQPQQQIKTGKITGAEALVRWNHPDLGLLSPEQFIPLAEETGLVIEIDQWVLRTACEQLKIWEGSGHALPFVTANLSARQFQQPALVGMIAGILNITGLNPGNLGIEITETLAMRDTELTFRNLNLLNEMGVKLLIDDFGTGYSSLSYLKKLPIHKLKIDKSFITDLAKDKDDQAITNAIIAMAHILKLKVVAEGVETKGQQSLLASQDCDEMQGFLFSEPVTAEEFEKLLVA